MRKLSWLLLIAFMSCIIQTSDLYYINADSAALSPVHTKVIVCDSSAIALKSDGTVWSWGDNSYYQLGDGANTSRTVPAQVQGLSDIVAIDTG